ncbi:MAG: hypothetical protein U0787_01725 [Polyangia bacterium]
MSMSRVGVAVRMLLLLAGLSLGGCASVYVSWMQPRADGTAEFVLFSKSRSLGLRKSGGEFFVADEYTPAERVLWKEGAPSRFVGKSNDTLSPPAGLVPRYIVTVALCSPPESLPASDARQREGDPLVWCLWKDEATQTVRVEARLPFVDPPRFRQVFQGPDLPASVEPLSGQRAVMTRGGRLFLLDAQSGTVQLVLREPAELRGATADGDLLVSVQGGPNMLLLRSHKVLPLPTTFSMGGLAAAAGALWMTNLYEHRLFRIDPETATLTEVVRPVGCVKLLGGDVLGHLWFSTEPSEVRRGHALSLCRWDPKSPSPVVVQIPTEL